MNFINLLFAIYFDQFLLDTSTGNIGLTILGQYPEKNLLKHSNLLRFATSCYVIMDISIALFM